MHHAHNEKRETTHDGKNRTTNKEKETYKYFGISEADNIKQVRMKRKIKKDYIRKTRKLLESKLNSRNLITWIDIWAVLQVRYLGSFLKLTKEELKQMDQRTKN